MMRLPHMKAGGPVETLKKNTKRTRASVSSRHGLPAVTQWRHWRNGFLKPPSDMCMMNQAWVSVAQKSMKMVNWYTVWTQNIMRRLMMTKKIQRVSHSSAQTFCLLAAMSLTSSSFQPVKMVIGQSVKFTTASKWMNSGEDNSGEKPGSKVNNQLTGFKEGLHSSSFFLPGEKHTRRRGSATSDKRESEEGEE